MAVTFVKLEGWHYDIEQVYIRCASKLVAERVALLHRWSPHADEPELVNCSVFSKKQLLADMPDLDSNDREDFDKWLSGTDVLTDPWDCTDVSKFRDRKRKPKWYFDLFMG